MGKSMKIHDLLHFFEAKIDFYEKEKKKEGGSEKGVGGGG